MAHEHRTVTHHSTLPWDVTGEALRSLIRASDLTIVAVRHRLPREIHEENFNLIVRAVNSHDSLVLALEDALLQIEYLHKKFKATGSGEASIARIRAALALASSPTDASARMEDAPSTLSVVPNSQAKTEVEG